jgi:aminoglycoside phosphotransferase family enzyme
MYVLVPAFLASQHQYSCTGSSQAIVALHGPLEQFSSSTVAVLQGRTHAGIISHCDGNHKHRAKICLEPSDWEEQLGPLLHGDLA